MLACAVPAFAQSSASYYVGTGLSPFTASGLQSCQLVSGTLPTGLTLNNDCSFGGRFAAPGDFSFAVLFTYTSGTSQGQYLFHVRPFPTVTAPRLTAAQVGVAYPSAQFTASDGYPPYTWSFTGSLPPGLTFVNGLLSGTPTTLGQYAFTVQLRDSLVANISVQETIFVISSLTATPTSLSFTATQGTNPAPQQIQASAVTGATFVASASTSSGGGWLGISPAAGVFPATISVFVNSTSLAVGTYNGTVTIAAGVNVTVPVTLTVTPVATGQLTLAPASLAVQALAGTSNPATQSLTIGSTGTSVTWTASATTNNGGDWLGISPASGSATVQAPSAMQVSFSAQGLPPGVYTGTIVLNPGSLKVAVRLVITPPGPTMAVGQSGLLLTGVADGGPLPAQAVTVANTGSGTLSWTATVLRGTGITLSSSSGASAAGAASAFVVQANTTGVAAGTYYGLIQVAAAGAANSPQLVTVVLNVLAAGSAAPVRVFPQGLIFVASTGTSPSPQTVSLVTGSSAAVSATVSVTTQTGGNWLSAVPSSLSLSPSGSLTLTANASSLNAGVYPGTVTVLPSNGTPAQEVTVYLVVIPTTVADALRRPVAAACTPGKLIMALRQLSNNFASPVGWPVTVEGLVLDDCGNPALAATVVASFSNGDAPLVLANLRNGVYSGTWNPANNRSTTITVQAVQAPLAPATLTLSGQVSANAAAPPSVAAGGVVNAASFAPGVELAPGSIVSVFGSNLATSDGNLAGFPLPTTLAGIKLTVGGIDVPLFYAGKGQVNAQIPYELAAGSQSQLVARGIPGSGGELVGVPEAITVGVARPGIFIAGGTQGAILNVSNQVVDATTPATASDVIVIFCTGLGATSPPSQTGQPASSGVAVLQPTVTVGGVAAPLQYAGVAPGFVGLYQVNVVIPPGVSPGGAVPVVITQGGVASNIATIAIR